MTTLKFFLFSLLLTASACQAQKNMVECVTAQRGNTGNRGIVPKEDMDKPRQGKDFFALQLKVAKGTTIELVSLTVKDFDNQIVLKPIFSEHNTSKLKTKAGETYYIRAEKEENCAIEKLKIKNEGVLVLKVKGKFTTLPITQFEYILPQ